MILTDWQHAIMTSTAFKNGEKIGDFNIYTSNALGAMIMESHDEKGDWERILYAFFLNTKEFKNIMGRVKPKNNIDLEDIRLNMYYKVSERLLKVLIRTGYTVTTFYEEPEKEIHCGCRTYEPSDFYPYGGEPMRLIEVNKEED